MHLLRIKYVISYGLKSAFSGIIIDFCLVSNIFINKYIFDISKYLMH
jgi:hypothetical protein